MIRISLDIRRYNWTVHCFIGSVPSDCVEIYGALERIGCKGKAIGDARKHLSRRDCNAGLTYSNTQEKKSVMVIEKATSEEELLNTIAHESLHVVSHICGMYNISMDSEEPCYLLGWIVGKCYFC